MSYVKILHMTYTIAVTRFNESTWREQRIYMENHKSLFYNSPCHITDKIPINNYIIVLEMHNDDNKIKGIGLIKNYVINKKKNIFTDKNYNRFTYKSLYRFDRSELNLFDESVLKFFDIICFTGSRHLKRGKGIQRIPDNIIEKCRDVLYFPSYFEKLFENKI